MMSLFGGSQQHTSGLDVAEAQKPEIVARDRRRLSARNGCRSIAKARARSRVRRSRARAGTKARLARRRQTEHLEHTGFVGVFSTTRFTLHACFHSSQIYEAMIIV